MYMTLKEIRIPNPGKNAFFTSGLRGTANLAVGFHLKKAQSGRL
jgi:hypothetical protein